jgi:hypothetical protein
MLKQLLTLLLISFIVLNSCTDASEASEKAPKKESVLDEEKSNPIPEIDKVDEVETPESNTENEISSRYHYDEDWEAFKTAIINKDVKAVQAFAGSDSVDAVPIIEAFSDPDFLAILKKRTYDDLEAETDGDEVLLVFSAVFEGDDGEGNIFASGLYLYFSQGHSGLVLENFLAAG